MKLRGRYQRGGISLLEVMCALAIFLLAWAGIGQLISQTSEAALQMHLQSEAASLCQAKLAEVSAGAVPLVSQPGNAFDEDPDWQWSLDCETSSIPNLWTVHVRVSRVGGDFSWIEVSMNQLVLDPAVRGSTMVPPTQGSNASGPSSSGGT